MAGQLANRTAIVTGASSGVGRAIAELFGSEGAHVFMIGRTIGPMEESKVKIEQSSGNATIAAFDLQNVSKLQAFIEQTHQQSGRLDILVNNAGVSFPEPILEANPENWQAMLETNVLALLVGSQAAVRAMRHSGTQGNIVNISSTTAQNPASGVYGATKHMVNVISATLRKELENDPIRVTTIMPGGIATNFARNYDPEVLKGLIGELPFEFQRGQRISDEMLTQIQTKFKQVVCSPEDVARTVLYAITQSIDINIAEIVVCPPRAMDFR